MATSTSSQPKPPSLDIFGDVSLPALSGSGQFTAPSPITSSGIMSSTSSGAPSPISPTSPTSPTSQRSATAVIERPNFPRSTIERPLIPLQVHGQAPPMFPLSEIHKWSGYARSLERATEEQTLKIMELSTEIRGFDLKMEQLTARFDARFDEQATKIERLEEENKVLKEENRVLKEENRVLKEENKVLHAKIATLEEDLSAFKETTDSQHQSLRRKVSNYFKGLKPPSSQ